MKRPQTTYVQIFEDKKAYKPVKGFDSLFSSPFLQAPHGMPKNITGHFLSSAKDKILVSQPQKFSLTVGLKGE